MKYNILPQVKKYIEKEGFFNLESCEICIADDIDRRIVMAAAKLKEKLSDKTGSFHKFTRNASLNSDTIHIFTDTTLSPEEYNIKISESKISIAGGDAAGCFYAIKTFTQILDNSNNQISCLEIRDYPDMKYRGFYHDVTRGRVPTVKGVKDIVDFISSYKMNSLQLYVEHSFDFKEFNWESKEDCLTAEEILELDEYCYNNFIDFIPSLSTFGHLYELLCKKEFSHLCELENYERPDAVWDERMSHHTIDASNPESFKVITSLIDQYLPLFRSKYFNICCDETFDLCKGRNNGKDAGKLYVEFVSKLINHVNNAGKTAMMWGDIILKYPDRLCDIPKGTIMLNWDYSQNPNIDKINIIKDSGYTQIVCPGTTSWSSLIEEPIISIENITRFAERGFNADVWGLLNTNWGDYGHPAHFESSLYGTLLGACCSWRVETEVCEEFNTIASKLVYNTDINIIPMIYELGEAQFNSAWSYLYVWCRTRDVNSWPWLKEIKQIEDGLIKSKEIIKTLENLENKNKNVDYILNSAKGIVLLNEGDLLIRTNGSTNEEWKNKINIWFEEYKNLWLKSNKQSELLVIKDFLNRI